MATQTNKLKDGPKAAEDLVQEATAGQVPAPQAQGGALANRGTTLPAGYSFEGDEGAGMEDVTREEIKLPSIVLLQVNSPQCEDGSAKYMPAARAGMFFNTATGDLYDGAKGIPFVPAKRDHKFVEFTPRDLGGGFLGAHEPKDPAILELIRKKGSRFGKLSTTTQFSSDGKPMNGTEFQETFYLFVVVDFPDSRPFEAMLFFKSTQIAKYQNFVQRYMGFEYKPTPDRIVSPPIWAHQWIMTSEPEQRKGKNFKGVGLSLAIHEEGGMKAIPDADKVRALLRQDDPLYQMAKRLYTSFNLDGGKRADYSAAGQATAAEVAEEEIPM